MKKGLLACLLLLAAGFASAQIVYIGITNHNTGTGANNLFNNHVAVNQQCYVDWEVYAEDMTNMEACGLRSVSRLILRRMGAGDLTSVSASAPIIVPGICGGKNDNNDKYYADLGPYINKPGRYSVEIQADLPNQTNAFENASTKTTNNYSCPSAYYLTGTGGPTGNYYIPEGVCAGAPGLSDPVGGAAVDKLEEIFSALNFFTVGEAAVYREMIVLNNQFFDAAEGRFQPGNPVLPASLDGTAGIPITGICPVIPAPPLSMGGEINSFKRTDCSNADITGAAVFYRLYKTGTAAPAYASFPLAFKDDCSFSPNGPQGNIFPEGGSCQNANDILDQRWQTTSGNSNIFPPTFALSDTGLWKIEFYTETYTISCSGVAAVLQGPINSTSFTVNNPFAIGSPCSSVVPVILSAFTVSPTGNSNLLNWTVEEASQVTGFQIQRSFDGYAFTHIGTVQYNQGRSSFNYMDAAHPGNTVFYRIVVQERSGQVYYSSIVRIRPKGGNIQLNVQATAQNITVVAENFSRGRYHFCIHSTTGSLLAQSFTTMSFTGNANIRLALQNELAHGIYYLVARDEKGVVIAKRNFYY
jgi:hypothetical protein